MTDDERAIRRIREAITEEMPLLSKSVPQLKMHLVALTSILSNYVRAYEEAREILSGNQE